MKIDLSKYPPGTQFKIEQGDTITLIGKSVAKNDCYILEYNNGTIVTRSQNGEHSTNSLLSIKSVIQPDKYLVSYRTLSGLIHTTTVVDPKSLTTDSFYESVKSVTFRDKEPNEILSWSKIEE